MKLSIIRFIAYFCVGATISLFCATGVAAPNNMSLVPSAINFSDCYSACIAKARNKRRVHGTPSPRIRCRKKCSHRHHQYRHHI